MPDIPNYPRRPLKMVPTDEELFRRFVRSQERIAEALERIDVKLNELTAEDPRGIRRVLVMMS